MKGALGLSRSSSFLSKADFDDLAATGTIDPKKIRFSQSIVSSKFQNGNTLESTIAKVKSSELKASDFPAIRIVEKEGKIFTLDNRRLKVFQDAGVNIRFQKLDKVPKKEGFKFRDYNSGKTDGTSIRIRGKDPKS